MESLINRKSVAEGKRLSTIDSYVNDKQFNSKSSYLSLILVSLLIINMELRGASSVIREKMTYKSQR